MTRLRLDAPGFMGEVIALTEGDSLVVGRAPSVEHVAGSERAHVVGSPSVSANHLRVSEHAGVLSFQDLGSTNGTWLKLLPGCEVRVVAGGEHRVMLSLQIATPAATMPVPAQYESDLDYSAAVRSAVQRWLADVGIDAKLGIASGREATGAQHHGRAAIPLADGKVLVVQIEHTVNPSFHDHMAAIHRYVVAQNALFVAESALRQDGVILASERTRELFRHVARLALDGYPSVVLLGASGTGKERLARAFHRAGPFVSINCSVLRAERLVADLFGAERGAYTGADRAQVGAVELADGGTLFLDEIADLPLDAQAMLLRFLQSGEYQRLGSIGVSRRADVRVVAATNRDLRALARQGAFRTDLFYRLALEIVEVPPLRERFGDVRAFLATQMLDTVSVLEALQPDGLEALRTHAWEGNFRELINFARRVPRPTAAGQLDAETVRRILRAGALLEPAAPLAASSDQSAALAEDWLDWVRASMHAFSEANGVTSPRTWGQLVTFVEHYFKPWALAHLAGVQAKKRLAEVPIPHVADELVADRGTVTKQLRRYFDLRGERKE